MRTDTSHSHREHFLIDVGHTRSKFAKCQFLEGRSRPEFLERESVLKSDSIPWDTFGSWFSSSAHFVPSILATDQQRLQNLLQQWPGDWPQPQVLKDKQTLPLKIDVDYPEKVGMDRLLNAIAANRIRHPSQPAINVCSGTAVTVDVVDHHGVFRGGAILPGILMTSQSMRDQTTTLPLIDPWELLKVEPDVLGRNTEAAIASGVYWGHLGAVRELIARFKDLLRGEGRDPVVYVTGGAARILTPYLGNVCHEPTLTLEGLAYVATK
ncbi:MAG: type III pantothenate kinase [Planctomycetaceae bacterium]|nr:type III pantothenate kinase [Planctomycetaceae bacterium]